MATDRESRDRDLFTSLTTLTLKAAGAALLGQPVSVSPRTYRIIDNMIEDARLLLRATTDFRGYRHPGIDRTMAILSEVVKDEYWIEDGKPLKALAEGESALNAVFGVTATGMNTLKAIAESDCPLNKTAQGVINTINNLKKQLTFNIYEQLGIDANIVSVWLNKNISIRVKRERDAMRRLKSRITLRPPILDMELPARKAGDPKGPCEEFIDQIWNPIKHVYENRAAFLEKAVIDIIMLFAGPLLRKLHEMVNDVFDGLDVVSDLIGVISETIYDLIRLFDIESWALFIAQYHVYRMRAMAFQKIRLLTSIKRRLKAMERLKGLKRDNAFINRINSHYAMLVRSLCSSIRAGERSRDYKIQHMHFNHAVVTVNRIIALLSQSRNSELPVDELGALYKEKYSSIERLVESVVDENLELQDQVKKDYLDHAHRIAKDMNYVMNLYMGVKPFEDLEKKLLEKLTGRTTSRENDTGLSAAFVTGSLARIINTPRSTQKGMETKIDSRDAVKVDRYIGSGSVREYSVVGLLGGITMSLQMLSWIRAILKRDELWLKDYYQNTLFQQVRALMEKHGVDCNDIERFQSEFELLARRTDYSIMRWDLREISIEADAVYKDTNNVRYIGDYMKLMERLDNIRSS